MITPHWLPLTMRRNDNPWRHRFNIMAEPGVPLDMTRHRGRMQIRMYEGQPDDPNLAVSNRILTGWLQPDGTVRPFAGGQRFLTTDSANGSKLVFDDHGFEIVITNADLVRFPAGGVEATTLLFSYDILITTPAGDENAWYEGDVIFREGVTRPYQRAGCPEGLCKYGGDTCAVRTGPYIGRWCQWDFPPMNTATTSGMPVG